MTEQADPTAPQTATTIDQLAPPTISQASPPPAGMELTPKQKFIESLPESYRTNPKFGAFESMEDLARSYDSAASLVGMDKNHVLPIPKDGNEEAMANIYNKLGRPETPDGYNLAKYKEAGLPEEKLNALKDIAHKSGVSAQAFESMLDYYAGDIAASQMAQQNQMAEQVNAWQSEVKQEFGAAYDVKLQAARHAVEKMGLSDIVASNPASFEHPAIIKALAMYGEQIAEDTGVPTGTARTGPLSPNEAKMALAELTSSNDYLKITMDPSHPLREQTLAKRQKLFDFAYPEARQ